VKFTAEGFRRGDAGVGVERMILGSAAPVARYIRAPPNVRFTGLTRQLAGGRGG
jgi:hypothetical protein